MKQIESFNIARLHTQEDFSFLSRVLNLATELLTQESDLAMVATFRTEVEAYDVVLKRSESNSYTTALNEADAVADKRWGAANAYVKAMAEHPDPDIAAAGATVAAIFKKYGTLTTMGFDEEYGRYDNLLKDIADLPKETLELIYFADWYDSMSSAMAKFLEIRTLKVAEDASREAGVVKECRVAADAAYKSLAQRVNALVIVNGEDPYADFIDQVNVMIADAQAMLSARATRAANAKEEGEE